MVREWIFWYSTCLGSTSPWVQAPYFQNWIKRQTNSGRGRKHIFVAYLRLFALWFIFLPLFFIVTQINFSGIEFVFLWRYLRVNRYSNIKFKTIFNNRSTERLQLVRFFTILWEPWIIFLTKYSVCHISYNEDSEQGENRKLY